jgi:hypothetical protein
MIQTSFLRPGAMAGVLAGVLVLAPHAVAQETVSLIDPAQPFAAPGLVPPLGELPDLEEVAVADDALDHLSGKGDTTISITDQDLTAVSSGNTISAASVTSGAISLTDNALAGFGGVGNFLMNTGHNNSLQSNVSVTIIVTQ